MTTGVGKVKVVPDKKNNQLVKYGEKINSKMNIFMLYSSLDPCGVPGLYLKNISLNIAI